MLYVAYIFVDFFFGVCVCGGGVGDDSCDVQTCVGVYTCVSSWRRKKFRPTSPARTQARTSEGARGQNGECGDGVDRRAGVSGTPGVRKTGGVKGGGMRGRSGETGWRRGRGGIPSMLWRGMEGECDQRFCVFLWCKNFSPVSNDVYSLYDRGKCKQSLVNRTMVLRKKHVHVVPFRRCSNAQTCTCTTTRPMHRNNHPHTHIKNSLEARKPGSES